MRATAAYRLSTLCGVTALATGLVYLVNLPALTSDATNATVPWGWLALLGGMLVLVLVVSSQKGRGTGWAAVGLLISLGFMFLLQLPPIGLWFLFHGQVISDGPVGPVGHWAWSLPHIVVAAASAAALYLWWRPYRR